MRDPSTPPVDAALRAAWMREIRHRLSSLRLSQAREAEIVDELSLHLEDRWRELVAGGASPEDAGRVTLTELADSSRLAEHLAPLRQAHAGTPLTPAAPTGFVLSDLWQDLRYAARVFRKQTGFAAASVMTLALGIGAATAIFSVVHGVLLKPLPFQEPDSLVSILHRATADDSPRNHGPATYFTYLDHQRAFEGVGAWEDNEVTITGHGDPEHAEVLSVSDATLPLLRVTPFRGRFFTAAEDKPGQPLKAVLTYGYWQRRFGGADDVLGKVIAIDGAPAEIVGVLPARFKFLRANPSLLLPMQLDRADAGFIQFDFQVLARTRPGVTMAQANADVARMIALLPQAFERLRMQPNVTPLADAVVGDVRQVLWILLAVVGVVLLIACANVANLFLIRAEARQQELAMRAALGASRARIARVLLSESLLLALAGGVLGVIFAEGAIVLLRAFAPEQLPRVDDIGVDAGVLLFTLAISLLSGMLFGLVAVLRFGTPAITAFRAGGRSASDAPERLRTRNVLVVGQVALALMLMIVSGLMIRTVVAMRHVQPGFVEPANVQTFRIAIPAGLISDPVQAARTHQVIAERLAAIPGVASVGLSSSITMDGEDNGNYLEVENFPVPEGTLAPARRFKSLGPGYFETLGNALVAGRSVTWSDVLDQRPVIVLAETLAREYWKDPARAIGQRVRGGDRAPWREIIGVVADARDDGLNHPATPIAYWPLVNETYPRANIAYAVRSERAGTATLLREIEQAIWSVNRNLPLSGVQTLDEIQARSMAQTSFAMVMLAISAGVALLLGVVGIYGVVAYIVAQRTKEIGIRIALGAQMSDVRGLFLRYGLTLTSAGIAVGVVAAIGVTRVIAALLFGVGPLDAITYAAVSTALAAVALMATYLPARRASRVDPVVALRADA